MFCRTLTTMAEERRLAAALAEEPSVAILLLLVHPSMTTYAIDDIEEDIYFHCSRRLRDKVVSASCLVLLWLRTSLRAQSSLVSQLKSLHSRKNQHSHFTRESISKATQLAL
jgi:hypothetical protein